MSMVINTNMSAASAAKSLQASQASLDKSLARLSSGSKITSASDDAGGLAVSMKLDAQIERFKAIPTTIKRLAGSGTKLADDRNVVTTALRTANLIHSLSGGSHPISGELLSSGRCQPRRRPGGTQADVYLNRGMTR